MRILVDVMGGDHAPFETVKGAVEAAKEYAADYTLIGDREQIEKIAGENGWDISSFTIVHTTDVMTMEDDPLSIRRAKKDCSMAIGLRMLANGEGDAFVSTGNTGALFTGATLLVRRIPGIQRAALATVLPGTNPVMLLDCGANVVVEPDYLEQFAVMGSIYMKKMFSLESPRVALLNNGTESCKGTPVHVEAYQKLSQLDCIHFVGNVEANKIAIGACDVLVTDGFTGNILLKNIEGLSKFLLGSIKEALMANLLSKLGAVFVKKPIRAMKKSLDPNEYGGAPLLGIAHPVIKAHGSSNAKAFKNAIRQAIRYAESGMIDEIAKEANVFAEKRKQEREAARASSENDVNASV